MPSDPQTVARRVAEIAAIPDPVDGVQFLIDTLATRPIRDGALYAGVRAVMDARIATVLAEKLATALELGPANTRVRDFADIYVLIGTDQIGHAEVRKALHATAAFRGTAMRELSAVVGRLAIVRAGTYHAYRSGLGRDGHQLPARFDQILDVVIAFADPLVDGLPDGAGWDPRERRWKSSTS